jgi:hypothetical protein
MIAAAVPGRPLFSSCATKHTTTALVSDCPLIKARPWLSPAWLSCSTLPSRHTGCSFLVANVVCCGGRREKFKSLWAEGVIQSGSEWLALCLGQAVDGQAAVRGRQASGGTKAW